MSEIDPCARTITWGNQTYSLNLNHPWVRNVLSWRGVNGKPPAALLLGFETAAYTTEDVERILELGLIGAGMNEREADKLLSTHARSKPIAVNARAAAELLIGLYAGKPDDNASA
ncbi:gene transfer agent family protein [Bradyrhizobium arachidis]|uniref:gene transfer agent family protein n=1 Tax=Bradyrhizobium arachidis TaxID=858423 RepID=UPI002161D7F2|nr:gene transfer agent family protein [Bradyrhizobium arachidis]UVO33797.1 gene transfer agent family protein [Bradyrhizobium arachidis]